MRKWALLIGILFAACVQTANADDRVYELRTYYASPGKLDNLLARFRDHTCKLFEKHGIHQVGFWTVVIGESNADLYYILKWDSLDEREKKFAASIEARALVRRITASAVSSRSLTQVSMAVLRRVMGCSVSSCRTRAYCLAPAGWPC